MSTPDDPYAPPPAAGAPSPGSPAPQPPGPPPSAPPPGYGPPPPAPAPAAAPPTSPPPGYGPPPIAPGYGQPTYGQAAYGQPAYGQAYTQPLHAQPGAPWPATDPGTNGLAIASFVCSLVGLFTCGIGSLVGFILGLVALSQLKKRPQGGRGLALAGVWISAILGTIIIIGFIVLTVVAVNNGVTCTDTSSQGYTENCSTGSNNDLNF